MIRIERKLIAYDSVIMEPVYPQYLGLTEEQIRQYVKENPMPYDPEYTVEELIADLTFSEGIYVLPSKVKEETIEYVEKLLNDLA